MLNRTYILILFLVLAAGVSFFGIDQYEKTKTSESAASKKSSEEISTLILPHHDLVKNLRSDLFSEVKNEVNPKTVILVSPNHFNTGKSDIITTDKTWSLGQGQIFPEKNIINKIVNAGISLDENAFIDEHGITNLLPDIKKFYPKANIVPLIFKENVEKAKIENLIKVVSEICKGGDCLIIASVDFSHYQPGSLSKIHDSQSYRGLVNLDTDLIEKSEVDSRASLIFAGLYAKSRGTESFTLYKESNSGELSQDRDAESTSYILGWYGQRKKKEIADEITFMIGGDMMFDRGIDYNFRGNKLPDVMGNIGERFFRGIDLSLVNLEGPISEKEIDPDNTKNNLTFNFPPKTPEVLKWLGINAVSLANNHTLNNGQEGLLATKKILDNYGISHIGQDGTFDAESIKRFGDKRKIAVFALDALNTGTDLTKFIQKEKAEKNFVLIFPHWGNEYEPVHSKTQENLAHGWIDAGADIVVGSHPHVIQDAEIYKDKPVFYSLGNLLFDQNFSPETQRGLVLAGKFSTGGLELVLLPTVSKDFKPKLMSGDEKTALIKKFRGYLNQPRLDERYGYDKIELTKSFSEGR